MVIIRNTPNEHNIGVDKFIPGAQFIHDSIYSSRLKENHSFKEQIAAKLMVIAIEPRPQEKSRDGRQPPKPCESFYEEIAALSTEKAVFIIRQTIDAAPLSEIARLDKREPVMVAAKKQIEDRQVTMNGLTPTAMLTMNPAMANRKIELVTDPEVLSAFK
jgi:hypothetical protein